MRALRILAGALAAMPALACAAQAPDPVPQSATRAGIPELLRSARLWEALEQPEVERHVLEKILAVDRTEPTALLLLAQIELDRGGLEAARRILVTLELAHREAPQARELRGLVRVFTQDARALARLRVLERGGRMREALELARTLFPDGHPPGMLADEFASLLGRDDAYWIALRALLEERLAREDNPVDREALSELFSLHPPTQALAMQGFERLARQRHGPSERLAGAWKRAIGRLPEGEEAQAARGQYLARFGPDRSVEADLHRAAREHPAGDAAAAATAAVAQAQAQPQPQAPIAVAAQPVPGLESNATANATVNAASSTATPELADPGALRDEARVLRERGEAKASREHLERALALFPDQPWIRFDLAKSMLAAGEAGRALDLMREGAARAPADPDADAEMRFAAALVFAAADRDDEALASIAQIPPGRRTDAMRELEQRAGAHARERAARARPWAETGIFFTRRSATEGLSSLRGTEVPTRLSWPLARGGIAFAQADEVRIDGGSPSAADAPQLGSLLVNAPQGAFDARSRGTSLAAGWRGEDHRLDLGLVGAGGFAVRNWVGGWRGGFDLGAAQASVQAWRRVLTGSRLSYAGEIDPGTGIAWGGVTDNALSARLAREFAGSWNASTTLTFSSLQGRHVRQNTALQSRTTLERTIAQAPGLALRAGAVATYWHYARNENFTSLGLGGYYSPQRYASLGLSLALDYDRAPWSATLRATPSRSWTREDSAPWYPLDPALQSRAGEARHAASTGGGLAGSLHAAFQVGLAPGWSAGGTLDIDRSAYYAPTTAMLFLRWAFAGPISPALPVAPVPVSRF
jgi:tetratricopeptide (TPR) repeat protein